MAFKYLWTAGMCKSRAEGNSVSVSMSGNANGRDRNEETYGGGLKTLESESGQIFKIATKQK